MLFIRQEDNSTEILDQQVRTTDLFSSTYMYVCASSVCTYKYINTCKFLKVHAPCISCQFCWMELWYLVIKEPQLHAAYVYILQHKLY